METLLPVIVGGIIGLLGGLVGPPLAHWLSEGVARKKRRAEKLEELIGAVYAYDHWLELVRGIRVFGHEGNEPPSPLARAEAISVAYFSNLFEPLRKFQLVGWKYEKWILRAGRKRLDGNTKEMSDGFEEVYEPYRDKRDELIRTLQAFAKTELGE